MSAMPDKKSTQDKLTSVVRRLGTVNDEIAKIIQELEELHNAIPSAEGKTIVTIDDFKQISAELRDAGREYSLQKLEKWKQPDLARFYAHLGGPSRDKKKPKDWLVQRILWQLFDFQSGHELLKGKYSESTVP